MKPAYRKNLFPICCASRALSMIPIANSGEDGGMSYHVIKEERILYSLFDFPIDSELESILKNYGHSIHECDYEDWFPAGRENIIECDTDTTSRLCIFLNGYFNLKYPYYHIEFIPGSINSSDSTWKKHGPIHYLIEFDAPSMCQ